MAGIRILGVVVVMALCAPLNVAQAGVADTARTVTTVAGRSNPGLSVRRDADGVVQRTVTAPRATALRHATSLADVRRALRAPAAPFSAGTDGADEPRHYNDPLPVGDLNGDGNSDVVIARIQKDMVRFSAVAGQTGTRLWAVEVQAADWAWAEARMLSGPEPGVLLLTETFDATYTEDPPSGSYEVTTNLIAVAADGAQRWTREYAGTVEWDEAGATANGLASVTGVAPVTNAGDDVVMQISDGAFNVLTSTATTRVEVIDGDSGTVRPLAVAGSTMDFPGAGVVDDLDGDGLHDVVTAGSADGTVSLVAHSGVTGTPLWRSQIAAAPTAAVLSAGNFDGDEVTDLMLVGIDWEGNHFLQLTTVSGADGAVGWQRAADGLVGLGDIGDDGIDDVVVLLLPAGFKRVGVTYSAVTGAGDVLYKTAYDLEPLEGGGMISLMGGGAGDVDADGIEDAAHVITAYSFKGERSRERGVVSAATGRKLFDGPVGMPLYAPVSGPGDDLLTIKRTNTGVVLIARSGRTGRALWQRALRIEDYRYGWAVAQDLTGDGHAELLVTAIVRGGTATRVVDGATQQVLWKR